MGVLDFFKPKWKHSDPDVRRQSLEKIEDQTILNDIARGDSDPKVRAKAVSFITDQNLLVEIVKEETDATVRSECVEGIQDVTRLSEIATSDNDSSVRLKAATKAVEFADQEMLFDLLNNSTDESVKKLCLKEFTLERYVISAIENSNLSKDLRLELIVRIQDQTALARVALNDSVKDVRLAAVERLNDTNTLILIAKKDRNSNVRVKAAKKALKSADEDAAKGLFYASEDDIVKLACLSKLSDENDLISIQKDFKNADEIRYEAITRIENQQALRDAALNDPFEDVRFLAVEQLNLEETLVEVMKREKSSSIKRVAFSKIKKPSFLAQIAMLETDNVILDKCIDEIDDEELLVEIVKSKDSQHIIKKCFSKFENDNSRESALKYIKEESLRAELLKEVQNLTTVAKIAQADTSKTVRKEAVKRLDDQAQLEQIARNDVSRSVRDCALNKIVDDDLVLEIRMNDADKTVRLKAVKKLTDQQLLVNFAMSDPSDDVRISAIGKIRDQDVLLEIAKSNASVEVRRSSLDMIEKTESLLSFARSVDEPTLRSFAVSKINNRKLAMKIFNDQNEPEELRAEFLSQVGDKSLIENLARNSTSDAIRQKAISMYVMSIDDFPKKIQTLCELTGAFEESTASQRRIGVPMPQKMIATMTLSRAISKVEDQDLALYLLSSDLNEMLFSTLINKLTDQHYLKEAFEKTKSFQAKREILQKITDEKFLARIAKSFKKGKDPSSDNSWNERIRAASLKNVKDEVFLEEYFKNHQMPTSARAQALINLNDSELSKSAFQSEKSITIREAAIKIIDDEKIVIDAALNAEFQVREAAIGRMGDEETLKYIALNDEEPYFQQRALKRINDQNFLCEYINNKENSPSMRGDAAEKLTDQRIVKALLEKEKDSWVKRALVKSLEDETILERIALDQSDEVREAAIGKIQNQDTLLKIISKEKNNKIKEIAVEKIESPIELKKIYLEHLKYPLSQISYKALRKIKDEDILADLLSIVKEPRQIVIIEQLLTDIRKKSREQITKERNDKLKEKNTPESIKKPSEKITKTLTSASKGEEGKNEDNAKEKLEEDRVANNFEALSKELQKNIEKGKLNDSLTILRDILKDDPNHEHALKYAAVALNKGLRKNSPEKLSSDLLTSRVFYPVFAQCETCGLSWIPDPAYEYATTISVVNPIGGYCKTCDEVFCKKHFSSDFSCPECGAQLEPVKEPNGKAQIELLTDPSTVSSDDAIGKKHAVIVGSGFLPSKDDIHMIEGEGYLSGAKMGAAFNAEKWTSSERGRSLALAHWTKYNTDLGIGMGNSQAEDLTFPDGRKFYIFKHQRRAKLAGKENASPGDLEMTTREVPEIIEGVLDSLAAHGEKLPRTTQTLVKIANMIVIKCKGCEYSYSDNEKTRMVQNEKIQCPKCNSDGIFIVMEYL